MATPQKTEAILSASELELSFGHQTILDGATLAIRPGEKMGMVGRNGSGKSSFLKIVAGDDQPDAGIVSRRQGLVIGYLAQDFTLNDEATVEDNILAGAADLAAMIETFESGDASEKELARLQSEIDAKDGWNLHSRVKSLMQSLSTPSANRVVGYCSGGEKRRVGLCRGLIAQPDLLILDEPTNHLDSSAIEWLEQYLNSYRGACLFVTHDRYFLDRIATHIVELDTGKIFTHEGNYSDYLIARAERQERLEASEGKRQRFLKREIEWVRAGVKARGTKQRSRIDNFYAVKAEKAPERELEMDLILPPAPKLGNVVLNTENLGMIADVDPLFLGLDIEFRAGECIGIIGPNGAGKTTLLRALLGEIPPTEGTVRVGKKTLFNYVDQSRLELNEDNSVLEEVSGKEDFVQFGEEKLPVRSYLRRFLFTDDRINDRVGHLSGGEKNRVLLAKILRRGGNFLILDEPTNDLDLQTLRVLEEALINFTGTSLVVSHDRYFLDRVCDRVIVYGEAATITVFDGNYSYFKEKKGKESSTVVVNSQPKPKDRPTTNRARKLTFNETRELEGMEESILTAESELEEIETNLNDPQFFIDHATEAAELAKALDPKRAAIQALYDRWAELEEIAKGS